MSGARKQVPSASCGPPFPTALSPDVNDTFLSPSLVHATSPTTTDRRRHPSSLFAATNCPWIDTYAHLPSFSSAAADFGSTVPPLPHHALLPSHINTPACLCLKAALFDACWRPDARDCRPRHMARRWVPSGSMSFVADTLRRSCTMLQHGRR